MDDQVENDHEKKSRKVQSYYSRAKDDISLKNLYILGPLMVSSHICLDATSKLGCLLLGNDLMDAGMRSTDTAPMDLLNRFPGSKP